MISTVRVSEGGLIEVEFTLPGCIRANTVAVVGEFNDWCRDTDVMTQSTDGDWSACVALAPGRYRFRYVADDDQWLNDWSADDYVPNAFGGEDSVVIARDPGATHIGPTQTGATQTRATQAGAAHCGPRLTG